MKRYNGNGSSLGTASHLERHYPANASTTTKRSRKKCMHYHHEARWCNDLKVSCVGPSNELCRAYQEVAPNSKVVYHKKNVVCIGSIVSDPNHGIGMIINTCEPDFFEVKFCEKGYVQRYNRREVKKMLLKLSGCKQ